jgi:hypothetical protein
MLLVKSKNPLAKRALDRWDSSPFSSSFLAPSFFCSQTLSTPAHLPATQTVGQNGGFMGKEAPYTGRRNPRFVTVRRGGTLEDPQHRLLAAWAADCAEHVLDYFCS